MLDGISEALKYRLHKRQRQINAKLQRMLENKSDKNYEQMLKDLHS